MMSIFFEIYINDSSGKYPDFISEKAAMEEMDKYHDLLHPTGRLTIRYYKYKFLVAGDSLWYLFHALHLGGVNSVLNDQTFKCGLWERTGYLTFDYVDAGTEGMRIRQWDDKFYEDENRQTLYRSRDFMLQEIIIPKKEYIFHMLNCMDKYIAFERKAMPRRFSYLDEERLIYFQNEVDELRLLFEEKYGK